MNSLLRHRDILGRRFSCFETAAVIVQADQQQELERGGKNGGKLLEIEQQQVDRCQGNKQSNDPNDRSLAVTFGQEHGRSQDQ
jgi:hypothetical protein